MKIQVICKGSTNHGLGHLFRTRTFSKEVKGKAIIEVVAIVDKNLENIFSELSDIVTFVRNENEVPELTKAFLPDIVVFDLTDITDAVFKVIKSIPKITASISPVFNQKTKIDYLFTRSKYGEDIEGVKIFGGLEYSIFNEYCSRIPINVYKKNLKKPNLPIAISMGGTDSPNKTLKIIKALAKFPYEITIWVALGEGYEHSYNDLVEAVNQVETHEIILAKANKSTWDILGNSVLAILAGGLTTVEAVYAGLPSINLYEKEIHLNTTSKELFDLGISLNGQLFSDETLQNLNETLKYFYFNRNELLEIRNKTNKVVDKNGSKRVLQVLSSSHFSVENS